MYPQVDIRKIRERYFNYGVSIGIGIGIGIGNGNGNECYVRRELRSVAECLHDAATALGNHFSIALISYEGLALGCYLVSSMEHQPVGLAHTLMDKLARHEAAT